MIESEEICLPVASAVESFIENQKNVPEAMRGDLSALKLVPHFLSSVECDFFSRLVAKDSSQRVQQLANRKRLIFDSEKVADWFWKRLQPHNPFEKVVDEHGDTWKAVGINPRFRLVRYDAGDCFSLHQDGFHWPTWNKKTFATAMVYLNAMKKGEGGVTRFFDIHTVVEPAQGLLIVFLVNDLTHCGEKCESCKFLLRTDVYYELVQESNHLINEQFTLRRKKLFEEFERLSD